MNQYMNFYGIGFDSLRFPRLGKILDKVIKRFYSLRSTGVPCLEFSLLWHKASTIDSLHLLMTPLMVYLQTLISILMLIHAHLEKTAASHHHFLRKKRRVDQSETPSARVTVESNFLGLHRLESMDIWTSRR